MFFPYNYGMEIFFQDPDDVPVGPEEVRIRKLTATPYPDGRRVRVYLEITPFLQKPDAEMRIMSLDRQEMAHVSIIETIDPKMELTLHMPASTTPGKYYLEAMVFYRPPEAETEAAVPPAAADRTVVDQSQLEFHIPEPGTPEGT